MKNIYTSVTIISQVFFFFAFVMHEIRKTDLGFIFNITSGLNERERKLKESDSL